MVPIGIILGLCAATSNSVAYLFSRAFLQKHHQSHFHLLAISHLILGVVSVGVAAFLWPKNMPSFRDFGPSLLGTSLFYLAAQVCFFLALKKTEASRLSPMLGAKIIILAIISVLFMDDSFTGLQWTAILFSFIAAVLLTGAGSRVPVLAIVLISATCLGYCMSDINIKILIPHFESEMNTIPASMFATSLYFIVCGIVSLIMLLCLKNTPKTMWKDAIPFSILWYAAMLCLFGCFGTVGIIYGNILQSTRGIISVILAAFVSLMGFHKLEQKVSRWVLIKRIFAAALMTAAVAMFKMNES
jgi:drug/metabolite transporter (DMT)-like permease